MVPWVHLDSAEMPDGGGELRLKQRGAEFSIMLGPTELMNSRLSGSEEALATLACERLHNCAAPRVLIGGLGMGFTLRAALDVFGENAHITVAELVPAVAQWAKGPMSDLFGTSLVDPRVKLRISDVGPLIRAQKAVYDAILLDVDNGPEGLTRKANNKIYDVTGLNAAHAALRPGGVLAVWSAHPDRHFTQRLKKTGYLVDEVKVRANGKRGGARHVLWFAKNKTQRSGAAQSG